jgi:hypothetical protein
LGPVFRGWYTSTTMNEWADHAEDEYAIEEARLEAYACVREAAADAGEPLDPAEIDSIVDNLLPDVSFEAAGADDEGVPDFAPVFSEDPALALRRHLRMRARAFASPPPRVRLVAVVRRAPRARATRRSVRAGTSSRGSPGRSSSASESDLGDSPGPRRAGEAGSAPSNQARLFRLHCSGRAA